MNIEQLKKVLSERINHHKEEIERHHKIFEETQSKKQREKINKHNYKLSELMVIVDRLNINYCKCCGALK